ncbi:uncharacterized protein [Battus philenor]|uniref:uncharacterized protein n=1 Tax=Battus philenor TaxID=42288 RepID=UPI0035CEBD0C
MHILACILLIAGTTCLAHYRGGYETHNMIEREEPLATMDGDLVECPVCENISLLPSRENCSIVRENKKYKKCEFGTYINEVCGNRRDCYRGPGEQCTEKMKFDVYGQKCAYGYYCDNTFNVCTGLDYSIDSHVQLLWNHAYLYPLREEKSLDKHKPLMIIV